MENLTNMEWTLDKIVVAVKDELERARIKFPPWSCDLVYGAGVVTKKSGELMDAALKFNCEGGAMEACDKEAIQTIAMCVRFLEGK